MAAKTITINGVKYQRVDAPVPAAAPVVAKAAAPAPDGFVTFLRNREGGMRHHRKALFAKLACEIHPAGTCNRRFSPASSGRVGHEARLV